MASARLALHRLRDGRSAAFALALLIFVTAFVAALAPRALDQVADEALRGEIGAAAPVERNVQFLEETRYELRGDGVASPLDAVVRRGADLERDLPTSVAGLVVASEVVVDSSRWTVLEETGDPTFVRMRIQPGATEGGRTRLVAGRWPTARTDTVDVVDEATGTTRRLPVIEVAVSQPSLERTGWSVGDLIRLAEDPTDPLVVRGGTERRTAVRIVGAFTVADEEAAYWLGDGMLARPFVRRAGLIDLVDVGVLAAPGAYPSLLAVTAGVPGPFRYWYRLHVDPRRLEADAVDDLLVDLRRLAVEFPSVNARRGIDVPALRTNLLPLIEAQRHRWAAVESVLTVAAIGPAAVAVAALGFVAALVARRRGPALALAGRRGGSSSQLGASVALEGVILAVPAALAGLGVAVAAAPAPPLGPSVVAAAVLAALAVVLLVLAAAPWRAGALSDGPASRERPAASPRRLALESLVVAGAAAGAYLLRERGIRGASSVGELAGADPFVAAVPALAGLAAGIVATRLYPLPLALLARAAAGGRDLVPLLAIRRAAGGLGGRVLVVLMASATIAAFASAVLAHVERAADAIAWQEVGAPYRITSSGQLPGRFDAAALPGIEETSIAVETSLSIGSRGARFELLALDIGSYLTIVGGTGADPALPPELLRRAANPVPVVISTDLTTGPSPLVLGQSFAFTLAGHPMTAVPVEARDRFPSLALGTRFVVASIDHLRAAQPDLRLVPTTVFADAPDDAAPAIRTALASQLGAGVLDSQVERSAAIGASPAMDALRFGVALAAAIAAAYAALAVAVAIALAGTARAGEVAHLRMLGLSRRQVSRLVVAEHGPTVAAAVVAGGALGLGLFVLLEPGLGFGGLLGSPLAVPFSLGATQLAVVLGGTVAIAGVGIVLGAIVERRGVPLAALRRGIE